MINNDDEEEINTQQNAINNNNMNDNCDNNNNDFSDNKYIDSTISKYDHLAKGFIVLIGEPLNAIIDTIFDVVTSGTCSNDSQRSKKWFL